MVEEAYISEIFFSFQGEGLYIGEPQIFIRFAGCNLRCRYCDTKYAWNRKKALHYSLDGVIEEVKRLKERNKIYNPKVISLTGGEPLLQSDFLQMFLPKIRKKFKIYLETNGTKLNELKKILNYIDTISLDMKLPSDCFFNFFKIYKETLKLLNGKDFFIKIVLTNNTKEEEIKSVKNLVSDRLPLVLQPVSPMDGVKPPSPEKMNKFISVLSKKNIHIIPQLHKLLWKLK